MNIKYIAKNKSGLKSFCQYLSIKLKEPTYIGSCACECLCPYFDGLLSDRIIICNQKKKC